MTRIILIGYRGTGKSTVGRRLAERLGVPTWDSDSEVERRAGKTIAEIFALDGEATFRDLEVKAIADFFRQDAFVLATGGGAILREETRQRLRQNGHVVLLTAEPKTILQRIRGDKTSATMRPNLTSLPPLEEVVAVLEKRWPLYVEAAHQTVETDGKDVEQVIQEILAFRKEMTPFRAC